MEHRCVVTGHDSAGKSVFLKDEPIPPVTISRLGMDFHRAWGSDERPSIPADPNAPMPRNYFPGAGGYRFGFFTIPPDTKISPLDLPGIFMEIQQKLPGLAETLDLSHFGMHTTQTVDFDVVLSGEAWLELDDGQQVLLRAGDCVVQNGTRHAWHNRSNAPCLFAVCLLGADKRS